VPADHPQHLGLPPSPNEILAAKPATRRSAQQTEREQSGGCYHQFSFVLPRVIARLRSRRPGAARSGHLHRWEIVVVPCRGRSSGHGRPRCIRHDCPIPTSPGCQRGASAAGRVAAIKSAISAEPAPSSCRQSRGGGAIQRVAPNDGLRQRAPAHWRQCIFALEADEAVYRAVMRMSLSPRTLAGRAAGSARRSTRAASMNSVHRRGGSCGKHRSARASL
jgi:hypothetical protein